MLDTGLLFMAAALGENFTGWIPGGGGWEITITGGLDGPVAVSYTHLTLPTICSV